MLQKGFLLALFLFCLKISSAQSILDTRTDFFISESSIVNALQKLTKATSIPIAFSAHFFNNTTKVSLHCQDKSIAFVLEAILRKTSIRYKEIGHQIILFHGAARKIKYYTISGYIEDVTTKESLIAASVFCENLKRGTICNEYGFFSLTLPEGKIQLSFRYLGYKELHKHIDLDHNIRLIIALSPYLSLAEIVVKPKRNDENTRPLSGGGEQILMTDIASTPDIGGESDIMQILALVGGVTAGTAGELLVRGGSPGQNLVLLDGIPVYNPVHLSGIFSIFNSDVIRSTKLLSSSFPARYGGRASSVLDIRSREGNQAQWRASASTNLVSVSASLEGPFLHKKGAILLTARRTHNDFLFNNTFSPIVLSFGIEGNYHFYDINAKVNYTFSFKDRLFFSYYKGNDRFSSIFSQDLTIGGNKVVQFSGGLKKWGNTLYALRWNHLFNDKLFVNTTLTKSYYIFENSAFFEEIPELHNEFTYYKTISNIIDNALLIDFNYHPNPKHNIRFGLGYTYHQFAPEALELDQEIIGVPIDSIQPDDLLIDFTFITLEGHEGHAYFEDIYKLSKKWSYNVGLRFSMFRESSKTYFALSPRLAAHYEINSQTSAHFSVGEMVQYLHLVSPQNFSRAEDIWLPATDFLAPQKTWHFSTGMEHHLSKKTNLTGELYYKKMNGLVALSGLQDSILIDEDSDFIKGKGWAYGAEMTIRKTVGKTGGWLNYSLSWAKRQFEALNKGHIFYANYDRRHSIKLFLYHRFSKRFDLSSSFVFASPNPKLFLGKGPNFRFSKKEYKRSSAYHKLNVSFNWHLGKKFKHDIKLGISNVYNQSNVALYLHFEGEGETPFPILGLPLLPSLSYKLRF